MTEGHIDFVDIYLKDKVCVYIHLTLMLEYAVTLINCFALYDDGYFTRFLVFHLTIVNSLVLIFSSAVCVIDSSFLYVLLSLKHHSQGSI